MLRRILDLRSGIAAAVGAVAISLGSIAVAQQDPGEGGGDCEGCPGKTTPTCCETWECLQRDPETGECNKIQKYFYYFAP
jgi:hypothetical protein